MLDASLSRGIHFPRARRIVAMLLEQFDLHRAPVTNGRGLILLRRPAAIGERIKLDMVDTETRASAHHFHPLQRGRVHIVYDPTYLYDRVRRDSRNFLDLVH